jgi:hypothetical protein
MADTDLPDSVVKRLQDANARVRQAKQRRDAILQTVAEMAGVPPEHAKLDFENGQVIDTRENT